MSQKNKNLPGAKDNTKKAAEPKKAVEPKKHSWTESVSAAVKKTLYGVLDKGAQELRQEIKDTPLGDSLQRVEKQYKNRGPVSAVMAASEELESLTSDNWEGPTTWKQKLQQAISKPAEVISGLEQKRTEDSFDKKVRQDSKRHRDLSLSMREKYGMHKNKDSAQKNGVSK